MLQSIEEPGSDQRGFSAPRGAGHDQEVASAQLVDEIADLVVPAEENVSFMRAEGAKAGIGGVRTGHWFVQHLRLPIMIRSRRDRRRPQGLSWPDPG